MTKLASDKELTRELTCTTMDKGARQLNITVRGDGDIKIRAKGMRHYIVWDVAYLYIRGIREGRVRK